VNRDFGQFPPTIFDQMSVLAREHEAINLGQGFPEEDGPLELREAAARALIESSNQYPPMRGLPETREAAADHYRRFQGLDLDWRTEVTVTSGATEAIASILLGLLNPGDEVILIEPMYDAYRPLVARAGGVARYLRLEPPHWSLDEVALAAAFNEKTRAIVLNSPHNPAAALLDEATLSRIAAHCIAHDCLAICDDVWEHVVFDGARHQAMLAIPGMRERTVKVGSAGKMFQMTGWKVGFVCAAPELTDSIVRAHQYVTFTTPPNLQRAAAFGLAKEESFFAEMRTMLQRSRDRLSGALAAEGFAAAHCGGTYFMNVDLRASGIALDDAEFALRAVKEAGIAVIPLSAFYASDAPHGFIRLCFAKKDETLDRGVERLAKFRRAL
jgi:N-succinyldiaminopimelate aminotransferase